MMGAVRLPFSGAALAGSPAKKIGCALVGYTPAQLHALPSPARQGRLGYDGAARVLAVHFLPPKYFGPIGTKMLILLLKTQKSIFGSEGLDVASMHSGGEAKAAVLKPKFLKFILITHEKRDELLEPLTPPTPPRGRADHIYSLGSFSPNLSEKKNVPHTPLRRIQRAFGSARHFSSLRDSQHAT